MASPSLQQYNNLFAQNIQLSNQFKDLIQEYRTKNTSINSTVNSMISKVNNLVNNMGSSVFRPSEIFFDRTLMVSKNSLNITPDIKDGSQSNWVKVSNANEALNYMAPGKLTILHPVCISVPYGGYYETPRYKTDRSRSVVQFIIANRNASSDQINCEIDRLNLNVGSHGRWNQAYRSIRIDSVTISGLSNYKTLYVRFKNVNVPGKTGAAQNIVKYGDNAYFKVDRVCNYPEIRV